jgi:predicted AAA+ superfamily ATPase
MRSLDFEEFLWAKGYDHSFKENILNHMTDIKPFNETELSICNSLFMDYCILGGMPAVVSKYIINNTFESSLDTQRQLIEDYKEDIRKYADGVDQTRILNIFNKIAPQLAKENKKFQISKVASGARFRDYRGCIEWLNDSGIINLCYCLNYPELPLKGNYDDDKFKIYFSDTGLLVAMLDDESQDDLRANKNLGVYKGALYENIVGESLTKQGCSLYYYQKNDSSLEQDFFVRTTDNLVPVEVKATNGKAKSLTTLINSKKYEDIQFGIKLINGNIGFKDNIYTFPYFCTFLLKNFLNGINH